MGREIEGEKRGEELTHVGQGIGTRVASMTDMVMAVAAEKVDGSEGLPEHPTELDGGHARGHGSGVVLPE